jgi:glycosyltransferase involved in cell wall biosynthesis
MPRGLPAERGGRQAQRVPRVSVVLPAYNRASFLVTAISSVISQSVTDWELIVADDGSGEEARACLRGIAHPAVRLIELAHRGNPAEVRNVALTAAVGRYIAFLDSDDVWKPRKLELQLAALAAHPEPCQ